LATSVLAQLDKAGISGMIADVSVGVIPESAVFLRTNRQERNA